MNLAVFVRFSEVFPSEQSDFEAFKSLVRQLSLTDALLWCARFNLILSDPNVNERTKQEFGLQQFFGDEETQAINRIARQHGGVDRVRIFFRGQLLELLRWVCLLCENQTDDGETFTRVEVRRIFGKCLLLASDVWYERVGDQDAWYGDDIEVTRLNTLRSIRNLVGGASSHLDPVRMLGRGAILFREIFPEFHGECYAEFLSKTGLSIDQYYACLSAMLVHYWQLGTNQGNLSPEALIGLINVEHFAESAPDLMPVFSKFFDLESQTIADLKEALWSSGSEYDYGATSVYDYKALRERPILRTSDSRAIIVDPIFYGDKVAVGPLFHLLNGDKSHDNRLFSAFGNAFQLYVERFLKQMYQGSIGLADRLIMPVLGKGKRGSEVEIADACLDYFSSVILIEVKSKSIKESELNNRDYGQFLHHLQDRCGNSAVQLAKSIGRLTSGEYSTSQISLGTIQKIYPVLLVYDHLLGTFTYPHFLASRFAESLTPDEVFSTGEMRKNRYIVLPLITMTADDIEDLEKSVRHISLLDLLQDYSTADPNRTMGLHNFIATSKYDSVIYRSSILHTAAFQVLEEVLATFESHHS